MAEASDWIINTTDKNFETDVFVRSQLGLVLVDFWADWCAPCRALGPVLEKLAADSAGKFTLVKAATDDNQQAAGQLGVSGIPAVFAVLDGQIIDQFQGALPESEIKGWLDNLESATLLVQANQVLHDDPVGAEEKIRDVLQKSPDHVPALILLAEALLSQDRDEECGQIIQRLESRGFLEPEAEKIRASLALKSRASLDPDAARATVAANPQDFDARLALAEALIGAEQHAEAMDLCLALVEEDRNNTGEKARELMVEIFQALPADSELVNDYRRKLSMLLY